MQIKQKLNTIILSLSLLHSTSSFGETRAQVEARVKAELAHSVSQLNQTGQGPRVDTSKYCAECNASFPKIQCPPESYEALDDIYSNGIVGSLAATFGNGDLKDPRSTCNSALKDQNFDYLKLNEELKTKFPGSPRLLEMANGCFDKDNLDDYIESGRKKTDQKLAQAYLAFDFQAKNSKISDEYIRLIQARSNLGSIINLSANDCSGLVNAEEKAKCEQIKNCDTSDKKTIFDQKLTEVEVYIDQIKKAREEQKKIPKSKSYGRTKVFNDVEKKKYQDLEATINTLMEANPVLKSDEFKKLNFENKAVSKDTLSKTLKQSYENSAKLLDKRIQKLKKAQKCVFGQESSCSDSNEFLASLPLRYSNQVDVKNPQFNAINSFYACTESTKDARNKADDILEDIAITIAITVATMGAGTFVAGGATLLKAANLASKAKTVAQVGATVADLGYATGAGITDYNKCSQIENELKTSSAESLSCEQIKVNVYQSSNMSRCYLSAAITATGVAAGGALGLKLLKVPGEATTVASKSTSTQVAKTPGTQVAVPTPTPKPKTNTNLVATGPKNDGKVTTQLATIDNPKLPKPTGTQVAVRESTDLVPSAKTGAVEVFDEAKYAKRTDNAGNEWLVDNKTNATYRNGEKVEVFKSDVDNKIYYRTADGKVELAPKELLDGPVSKPASTAVALRSGKTEVAIADNTVPRPIKDINPPSSKGGASAASETELTLTRVADDIPTPPKRPPTTTKRDIEIRNSRGVATGAQLLSNEQVRSNIGEVMSSVFSESKKEEEQKADDNTGDGKPEEGTNPQTPPEGTNTETTSDTAPADTSGKLTRKTTNDECEVNFNLKMKPLKEKYPKVKCVFRRCSPKKLAEKPDECKETVELESGDNLFDKKDKDYYVYPVCDTEGGSDYKYIPSSSSTDDNKKVEKYLVQAKGEFAMCSKKKNNDDMSFPVIPPSAPNLSPNLMQAPTAPILIEY